jgi:palmitoyl-protein thioesterase
MRTFAAALFAAGASAVPTALFHGMGDACRHRGFKNLTKEIGEKTGDYSACFESGASLASIFGNFETQSETACALVQADPNMQVPEINVMGLSQGALIARYVATSCDLGDTKVRNVASIGGPNLGVDAIPGCFSGTFCDLLNTAARTLVELPIVQNHCGPCGYFRDPQRYDQYLAGSVFLPWMNNEEGDAST